MTNEMIDRIQWMPRECLAPMHGVRDAARMDALRRSLDSTEWWDPEHPETPPLVGVLHPDGHNVLLITGAHRHAASEGIYAELPVVLLRDGEAVAARESNGWDREVDAPADSEAVGRALACAGYRELAAMVSEPNWYPAGAEVAP